MGSGFPLHVRITVSLLHTRQRHRACLHTVPRRSHPARVPCWHQAVQAGGTGEPTGTSSFTPMARDASQLLGFPFPRILFPCLANPCVSSGSTPSFSFPRKPRSSPCPLEMSQSFRCGCTPAVWDTPQRSSPASHPEKPRGTRCVDSASRRCHWKAKRKSAMWHHEDCVMVRV